MRLRPAAWQSVSGWLAPVVVLAAIWAPIWARYRNPTPALSPQLVERARVVPADSVLAELAGARFSGRRWSDERDLVPIAERVLEGEVTVPGYPPTRVRIPFDPRDLNAGPPSWQLEMSSLVVPEILLSAYEASGQDRFLLAARDIVRSWAAYERRAVVPRGFLWNDHALASRTVVLGHFWRLYRRHPSYDPEVARSVLEFAIRGAQFLAAPGQYTYATNHGVMQNLALWHLAIAFPWMPRRESLCQLAFHRLNDQLRYYVDSQGAVLEHSAEYQAFGVELLAMTLRYRTLLGETAPPEWIRKYRAAEDVYRLMRRPDGTLPLLGDTDSRPEPTVPLTTTVDAAGRATRLERPSRWEPAVGDRIFANAGYALWWDAAGGERDATERFQTMVTWSHVAGHGHKHADELSVLLWGGGASWWTNVGYWPYDLPGRTEALAWSGSDAPHLPGEPLESERTARLLGAAESVRLSVADLERVGPGAYRARRQVVHVKPGFWLVLDQTGGAEGDRTTTTWTVGPGVIVDQGGATDTRVLRATGTSLELRAAFRQSDAGPVRQVTGNAQPFAGWVVHHGVPSPTTSLVVEQPARGAWAAAAWRATTLPSNADAVARSSQPPGDPLSIQVRAADDWDATLGPWMGDLSIRRRGSAITAEARGASSPAEVATLAPVPRDSVEAAAIEEGFRKMAATYPKERDHLRERYRVSGFLAIALVGQEAVFLLLRRSRGAAPLLRAAALAAWVILGFWLVGVYFLP